FSLKHALVTSRGPALLEVGEDSLKVREGSALVDGELLVQAAACANRVEGRARVSVREARVVIAVYEGRVLPVADVVSCDVAAKVESHAPRPTPRAETPSPSLEEPVVIPEPLAAEPSELARMVSAYRAALALETHDDEAA